MRFFAGRKVFAKYFFSGTVGAVVNIVLLYLLTEYGKLFYMSSTVIAVGAGVVIAFVLQKFWTFNDTDFTRIPRQLSFYTLISLVNLLLNPPVMYVLVAVVGLWYIYAQIIIVATLSLLSYTANRMLTFKEFHE